MGQEVCFDAECISSEGRAETDVCDRIPASVVVKVVSASDVDANRRQYLGCGFEIEGGYCLFRTDSVTRDYRARNRVRPPKQPASFSDLASFNQSSNLATCKTTPTRTFTPDDFRMKAKRSPNEASVLTSPDCALPNRKLSPTRTARALVLVHENVLHKFFGGLLRECPVEREKKDLLDAGKSYLPDVFFRGGQQLRRTGGEQPLLGAVEAQDGGNKLILLTYLQRSAKDLLMSDMHPVEIAWMLTAEGGASGPISPRIS